MKIVHFCPQCFIDNSTYQEKLLSKYQKKIGYDVEVITSTQGQGNGKIIDVNEQKTYLNDDGVKIIRLKYKGIKPFAKKFCQLFVVLLLCNQFHIVAYIF